MDPGDDAYQVLGVSDEATDVEIKKAYRRLALQYHPDRQQQQQQVPAGNMHNTNGNNTGNDTAHHVFAKISNAYEILSNTNKRREYDRARRGGRFYQEAADDYNDDNSFSEQHGKGAAGDGYRRASSRSSPGASRPHVNHHFDFFADLHDPFEVFDRVFQQHEFQHLHTSGIRSHAASPFDDPFFRTSPFAFPLGGGASLFGNHFGHDPFMASSSHNTMMNRNDYHSGINFGGDHNFITNMAGGGGCGGGSSVSVSTTTRIINGQRATVTERVVRHPDGRVERHVESSSDNSVSSNSSNISNRNRIGQPPLPPPSLPLPAASVPLKSSSTRRPGLSGLTRPRSSTSRSSSTGSTSNNNNSRKKKKDLDPVVVDLTHDE